MKASEALERLEEYVLEQLDSSDDDENVNGKDILAHIAYLADCLKRGE